eukprot:g6411.t1
MISAMKLWIFLVILLFVTCCRASPATTTQKACLALKSRVERDVLKALRNDNKHIVQSGSISFGFIGDEALLDCETNNCAFTNPKSPYGLTILPLAQEEDLEAKAEASSTPTWARDNLDAEWGPGNSPVWQLRFDEVVLAIGCTPPSEISRYFAFTGYLFDIYNEAKKKWVSSFGSLQDSLSVYREEDEVSGMENRLKTAAEIGMQSRARNGESTSAFNKLTVVVMGASKRSTNAVQRQLDKVLEQHDLTDFVNTIVISEPFAESIGLDPYDNYYALIVRNIVPEGQLEAFKSYADSTPLSAWRLTPKKELRKKRNDLFDRPDPLPRQLAESSAPGLEASYAEGLEFLIQRILNENDKNNVVAHALGSGSSLGLMGIDSGLDCIERFVDLCNGDNRDAQYLSTYPLMLLDNNEKFAYVVGVNHQVVGLTVYNNIAVSDPERKLGIASMDDKEMYGSADQWLKGTQFEKSSSDYYAIRFSRDCKEEKYCIEIPSEGPRAVPYDQQILVNSRLYVNPETGVGPSEDDVLMPHMMIFTPKSNYTRLDVRERVSREVLENSACMPAFLSLTVCTEGISADCCNGVTAWTENDCFCTRVGKLLLDTLPKGFGANGLRVLSMIWILDIKNSTEHKYAIVKAHSYVPLANDTAWTKVLTFTSHRDIRDVCASQYRLYNQTPCVEIEKYINSHIKLSNISVYDMAYEKFLHNQEEAVISMAEALKKHLPGYQWNEDLYTVNQIVKTVNLQAKEQSKSERLNNEKFKQQDWIYMYNKTTNFHIGHITDGKWGSFKKMFKEIPNGAELCLKLTSFREGWLRGHGYPLTEAC